MTKHLITFALAATVAASGVLFVGCESAGTHGYGSPGIALNDQARFSMELTRQSPTLEREELSAEQYDHVVDNPFVHVADAPRSTFSIDVDTASYANVRRLLEAGRVPPAGAVRIEELVNAFDYAYPQPADGEPIAVGADVVDCPWRPGHLLARVQLAAETIDPADRGPANLVFLIDTSGSMASPTKLELIQRTLPMLVDQLRVDDTVSIVTYAGASQVLLNPTSGDQREKILGAIDSLTSAGSTAGAAGLRDAYQLARLHRGDAERSRVILCTDGDFNVGVSSTTELVELARTEAAGGIDLTILGVGSGNLNDDMMESLSNDADGTYAYLDSVAEAERVLGGQLAGALWTVAKDVKFQVEFNPRRVAGYRLIGYENRLLADADFNDDKKDAGDVGAGQTVTAFYELVPVGSESTALPTGDPLVYQVPPTLTEAGEGDDWLTLRLRYKRPGEATSVLRELPLAEEPTAFAAADADFRFSAAVAAWGMLLRDSPYRGDVTHAWVTQTATNAAGVNGDRQAFVQLVDTSRALDG